MINRKKYQHLRIRLASPEQIRSWAERILPNGEVIGQVTKPYTLHYKTHKPEKDGLFCERIFGPIKSGICACENYKQLKNNSKFCKHGGVDLIDSRFGGYERAYIN